MTQQQDVRILLACINVSEWYSNIRGPDYSGWVMQGLKDNTKDTCPPTGCRSPNHPPSKPDATTEVSMTKDEYAFPREGYNQRGMSLRDYFAGQALVAMGTWIPIHTNEWSDEQARAIFAYAQADAMLVEREAETA